MIPNLTNAIGEVEGSEPFRRIIAVLIQEKPTDKSKAPPPRKKQPRKFRPWIERVLLVSGLLLLACYGASRLESFLSSRAALKQFAAIERSSSSPGLGVKEYEVSGPPDVDFSLRDEQRMRAYQENLNVPTGVALAVLSIPKIGLEVPVLDGTDGLALNHAVGRISGTARPGEDGNIGIAGHRDGFFRGLKNIRLGDTIELKGPQGTDTYVVDDLNVVNPADVHVLAPRSLPSLTLVTCYPFHFIGGAPQRYIVHASRTEFEPQRYKPTAQGSLTLANGK